MSKDPFRQAQMKADTYCILSVTLHNRMDETILVVPSQYADPEFGTDRTDDEALVVLLSDLNRSDCTALGIWVFISGPTKDKKVEAIHHLITPLQILAQAVIVMPTGIHPTDLQIFESLDYNTAPDKEGKPPPLPMVRWVEQTKLVQAKRDSNKEGYGIRP